MALKAQQICNKNNGVLHALFLLSMCWLFSMLTGCKKVIYEKQLNEITPNDKGVTATKVDLSAIETLCDEIVQMEVASGNLIFLGRRNSNYFLGRINESGILVNYSHKPLAHRVNQIHIVQDKILVAGRSNKENIGVVYRYDINSLDQFADSIEIKELNEVVTIDDIDFRSIYCAGKQTDSVLKTVVLSIDRRNDYKLTKNDVIELDSLFFPVEAYRIAVHDIVHTHKVLVTYGVRGRGITSSYDITPITTPPSLQSKIILHNKFYSDNDPFNYGILLQETKAFFWNNHDFGSRGISTELYFTDASTPKTSHFWLNSNQFHTISFLGNIRYINGDYYAVGYTDFYAFPEQNVVGNSMVLRLDTIFTPKVQRTFGDRSYLQGFRDVCEFKNSIWLGGFTEKKFLNDDSLVNWYIPPSKSKPYIIYFPDDYFK